MDLDKLKNAGVSAREKAAMQGRSRADIQMAGVMAMEDLVCANLQKMGLMPTPKEVHQPKKDSHQQSLRLNTTTNSIQDPLCVKAVPSSNAVTQEGSVCQSSASL